MNINKWEKVYFFLDFYLFLHKIEEHLVLKMNFLRFPDGHLGA